MHHYLTTLLLFVGHFATAQFSDNFSDGDFTASPSWAGDAANFEVDAGLRLHLLAPAVDDTSYLSVPTTNIDDTQWDFYVEMQFNPSSANNARLYLVSDNADLSAGLNGYFVMVGNTTDEVSLYRQNGTTITEILDGANLVVNSDPVEIRIRVTRDAFGNWEVFRDSTGGFTFVSEGTVSDLTFTANAFAGVFAKYTSTRSELFWFDDMGDPYVDSENPTLPAVSIVSPSQLDLTFSEPVDLATAENESNYSVDLGIGNPSSAVVDGSDPSLVHLTFAAVFSNGTNYNLTVNNVEDLFGNSILSPTIYPFFYFVSEVAVVNDVIIAEVMADPTPTVGLEDIEWFEIHNRSAKYFDLDGWVITDGATFESLPPYVLLPGAYVVICEAGDGILLGITNYIEGVGIPTLTNSEDDLILRDNTALTIDSIHYTLDWYNDTDKDDGGWTLERKHLNTLCNDLNNWGASIDPFGGTPGEQNSLWTDLDDVSLPTVTAVQVISQSLIEVGWSEILDTLVPLVVTFNPFIPATWLYTGLNSLEIYPDLLDTGVIYDVTISAAQDCWGNTMNPVTLQIGIPDSTAAGDIVINEVMFNPQTAGVDYIELVNVSDKILDLQDLYFANWEDDSVANVQPVLETQQLFLPGAYALVTEDSALVIGDFSIYGIGNFVQTDDLPTYPDDSGTVFLMTNAFGGSVIDYFHYDDEFHFDLLSSGDGKSLERISFGGGVNNPDNWHTASEFAEWGTPGYLNSQYQNIVPAGTITVLPQLFSPDSDGLDDVLTITLDLPDADNIVDIDVYDNQGRLIREVADNFYAGPKSVFTWDGINDEGSKAAIGAYVLLISILDANNDRTVYKEVCVLGGKF